MGTAVLRFARTVLLASSTVIACHAQEKPSTEPPEPQVRVEKAIADYQQQTRSVREEMVKEYERRIAGIRARSSMSGEKKAEAVDALQVDLEKFRASTTNVPTIGTMRSVARTMESRLRKARQELRGIVRSAAAELGKAGRHGEAEVALKALESLCPDCVDVDAFAIKMSDRAERAVRSVVKGRANGTTYEVREELDELVAAAKASKISAVDLTMRCRSLVQKIDGSQAVKGGGKHKELLEDIAAAIRVLLAERE